MEEGALLIDLRPHAEFATAYIPGSINLMFSRKSLPERLATAIPPSPKILLLSGNPSEADAAAEALQGVNQNPVLGIFAGGIEAWRRLNDINSILGRLESTGQPLPRR